MKVTVLASTLLEPDVLITAYGYNPYAGGPVTDSDALAEAAGRLCYKSWDRPNPATARNTDYLANIIQQGHESVLEHASVTFLVQGVSRALLAELTRHRHLSFSVVSQRYVDYSGTEPVIPPILRGTPAEGILRTGYQQALENYSAIEEYLRSVQGAKRKQAREAARAVLLNAAPVDMIVSGNLRAWRDVLKKRHSTAADAEMQELAHLVLAELRVTAPGTFQDIPAEPYGTQKCKECGRSNGHKLDCGEGRK